MKRTGFSPLSCSLFFSLASASACAQPDLITNGGFEIPVISVPNAVIASGNSAMTGWTVSGTTGIDIVRTLWQPAAGAQSISLNWASPCTIARTISTTPGACYILTYRIAAESPASEPLIRSLQVRWGGNVVAQPTFNPAGHTNTSMGWRLETVLVTGHGTDELRFESTTIGNYGPALDDVHLRPSVYIESHPYSVTTCRTGVADFFITALGSGTLQWQLETSPGNWINCVNGALPYNGGTIIASGATTDHLHLLLDVLPGVPPILFRCVVTSSCDTIASNTAMLSIDGCLADFNCDGVADFFDYLDFVDAFSSSLPGADFNRDGIVDFFDYLDFVDTFSNGC